MSPNLAAMQFATRTHSGKLAPVALTPLGLARDLWEVPREIQTCRLQGRPHHNRLPKRILMQYCKHRRKPSLSWESCVFGVGAPPKLLGIDLDVLPMHFGRYPPIQDKSRSRDIHRVVWKLIDVIGCRRHRRTTWAGAEKQEGGCWDVFGTTASGSLDCWILWSSHGNFALVS